MDLTSTFAPIAKTVEQDDGSLLVYGKATDGGLDLDDQRCDPTWLSTAMPEWFSSAGNIRAQHRADSAVGKAIEHTADSDGHYITARIVDRDAIAKTRAGVFTGFSIGIRRPKIVKSPDAPNGLINGGMITEVSLCDRPANPACTLMLCKAAVSGWEGRQSDFDQERGLVKCEDLNFYPENDIRLKTVSEPINIVPPGEERLIEALKQATEAIEAFVPAESKAPQNPTFSNAEKAKMCCDKCDGPGDNCGCGCDDCPADSKKSVTVITEKTIDAAIKALGDEPGFDRDAAIALVNKATDGLGQDETGDIAGANSAIAAIAQLIISEAKDLAKMPAQSCDIHLLMSAVDALRCFARREQMEQNAVDPDDVIFLAVGEDALPGTVTARGELIKSKYSADELRQMLKDGKAMKNPNGDPSYPIGDKSDLSNAIHAVGRGSGDHDSIRSYIKRRASALGASDMIPESWTKMAEATTTKADNVSDTLTSDAADVAEVENVEPVEKAADAVADEPTEEVVEQPEATKAVGAAPDQDSLVKAFTDALSEEDSPIRKMFVDIVEASTKSAAEALSLELGARLEKVEQMATPGGPTLRRTEVERVNARKSDLSRESMRYKALSSATEDPDLRKGYAQKALQIDAEIKAL
jgi:hypothetical protein